MLIIGQGISGTMLGWFLKKEGLGFKVIDEGREHTSSKIAAGIINPVTGRRYVTTWMIEDLMLFSKTVYAEFSDFFNQPFIYPKNIIDFFPSAQMRNAFVDRVAEDDTYLRPYPDQNNFNAYFNQEFGCGEICPSYVVDMALVVDSWRNYLLKEGHLMNQQFRQEELRVESNKIFYEDVSADRIIFCDGINSMHNSYFQQLPFSANKGECLIIEAEDLPENNIFKKGMVLVPLASRNQYWVGSSYQWDFEDDLPTEQFYQRTKQLLDQWLRKPYKILEHRAAVRPATLERRPFVGFHPAFPSVGILNGMGTKGASLAPYFAHQLVQHIAFNLPIAGEADVRRFNRILSK